MGPGHSGGYPPEFPQIHHQLTPTNLALVQSVFGLSLRDLYIQMLVLSLGTLLCTAWLPGKWATIGSASGSASQPETTEPELIVTGSES